ncbi:MAG: hypothetical protein ACFNTB_07650 [Prevotella denticola]
MERGVKTVMSLEANRNFPCISNRYLNSTPASLKVYKYGSLLGDYTI